MNLLTKNETPATQRRTITPRYTVAENADAFVITAFVPGVNRSDIETNLEHDTLTVVARRTWTPPTEWTAVHRETPSVDYRLVLELDHRFNRETVRAELTPGRPHAHAAQGGSGQAAQDRDQRLNTVRQVGLGAAARAYSCGGFLSSRSRARKRVIKVPTARDNLYRSSGKP